MGFGDFVVLKVKEEFCSKCNKLSYLCTDCTTEKEVRTSTSKSNRRRKLTERARFKRVPAKEVLRWSVFIGQVETISYKGSRNNPRDLGFNAKKTDYGLIDIVAQEDGYVGVRSFAKLCE